MQKKLLEIENFIPCSTLVLKTTDTTTNHLLFIYKISYTVYIGGNYPVFITIFTKSKDGTCIIQDVGNVKSGV